MLLVLYFYIDNSIRQNHTEITRKSETRFKSTSDDDITLDLDTWRPEDGVGGVAFRRQTPELFGSSSSVVLNMSMHVLSPRASFIFLHLLSPPMISMIQIIKQILYL